MHHIYKCTVKSTLKSNLCVENIHKNTHIHTIHVCGSYNHKDYDEKCIQAQSLQWILLYISPDYYDFPVIIHSTHWQGQTWPVWDRVFKHPKQYKACTDEPCLIYFRIIQIWKEKLQSHEHKTFDTHRIGFQVSSGTHFSVFFPCRWRRLCITIAYDHQAGRVYLYVQYFLLFNSLTTILRALASWLLAPCTFTS